MYILTVLTVSTILIINKDYFVKQYYPASLYNRKRIFPCEAEIVVYT
jgi:hypothetical protein